MKKKSKALRKKWFRGLKKIMRLFIKKSDFVYLGDKIEGNSIVLSNHVGTSAPLAWELYSDAKFRFWGASEMNSGLIKLYKYQTRVYYHEKKHWNIHLARLFCLIASPLTYLFYSGLGLISTYKDARFVKTIRESIEAIKSGDNIVIYPEISDKGYLAELEGFHGGFAMFGEICKKRGIDLKIYVSYFRKSDCLYIIDKPVLYSEISEGAADREEVCARLCARCNELGKMTFTDEQLAAAREGRSLAELEATSTERKTKIS